MGSLPVLARCSPADPEAQVTPRQERDFETYRSALEAYMRCKNERTTTNEESKERWTRLRIHERELELAREGLDASIIDEMP